MFKKHMTARCLEFLNNKSQICVRNKQIFTHLLRLKNTQHLKMINTLIYKQLLVLLHSLETNQKTRRIFQVILQPIYSYHSQPLRDTGQEGYRVASWYCRQCDSFGTNGIVSSSRRNMAEMPQGISDDFWDALAWDQGSTCPYRPNHRNKGERKRKKKKPIIDVFMEGKLILEKLCKNW